MKVKIYYTLTYETEAEVDDKFKALLDPGLNQSQRLHLKQELVKEANENIPMEAMLSEVWEDEEYGELLAKTAFFAGPTAP
jgi:hypothetical protein